MIAYHGTVAENIQSILDNGFKPETWFAREAINAIKYGGPCIFTVEFSDAPAMWHGEPYDDNWQFHISGWHGPENIVSLRVIPSGED